jgi:hypothetical protein
MTLNSAASRPATMPTPIERTRRLASLERKRRRAWERSATGRMWRQCIREPGVRKLSTFRLLPFDAGVEIAQRGSS